MTRAAQERKLAMSKRELIWKLEYLREDWESGLLNDDEYLNAVACMFDGDTEFALGGTPCAPRRRLVLTLREAGR